MVDRIYQVRQRSVEELTLPIKEIIPFQPLPVASLVNRTIPEPPTMHLQKSMLHPVLIRRKNSGDRTELACMVNHPLQNYQLLHLFNTYGKLRRPLEDERARRLVGEDVADDWGAMTPGADIPEGLRIFLQQIHQYVEGIKPFSPHLLHYVNALGDQHPLEYYSLPRTKKNILLPLLYFEVDRAGKIYWHDEVLDNRLNDGLLAVLASQAESRMRPNRTQTVLDTFAGLAVLPSLYPELAAHWPDDHNGHTLSVAQKPAQVWQNIQDFNRTPLMNNLLARLKVMISRHG